MNFDKTNSNNNSSCLCPASQANKNSVTIQRKLSVGAVNDPAEHEANTVADKVMRMPEQNFVQRKCAHCEEKEEERARLKPLDSFIQKKENSNNNHVSDAVSNQIAATNGNGNAMPASTKSFMESRFGNDFSNVRIHADNNAAQLSNQLNAQAFTVGNNIYFNEGRYQPESTEGKHLLAHELTHTIQQNGATSTTAMPFSIQREFGTGAGANAPLRKTIWVNIGFDSSAKADEKTIKKLKASINTEKAAIKSCCSAKSKACDIDVKTNYDWDRVNKPAPTDGDYDNDNAADKTLQDSNIGKIKAPNGGIKILVTESTLSQTWEGVRIFPRANTGAAGVLWNPNLAADDTIAHESGHAAGYVGDIESNSHSSDKHNIMSPGSIREAGATPDDSWCDQMATTAV